MSRSYPIESDDPIDRDDPDREPRAGAEALALALARLVAIRDELRARWRADAPPGRHHAAAGRPAPEPEPGRIRSHRAPADGFPVLRLAVATLGAITLWAAWQAISGALVLLTALS
ncbi:hypothetical protein GCM10010123_08180 [Pilimelia anulata]|uniref:Uncharacterized protein n=1 Tax=Pilimelia anulata TaxID=53371 RepID=A0A8J3F7Q1_9ACTN|nr:hypothetical protein [Pilimelia anulata]GGJ80620.1 hypothetical protein GCM10010123_08180 [Pilimelia anulata]